MFTVILLSPSAKRIFERSRVFFETFVTSGHVAFCEWRYSSTSTQLSEVVPGLAAAIRGRQDWRVVVVDHPREGSDARRRDAENPFDYHDNTRLELNLEDSPFPLIRLANLLLGYPDLSAKSFERMVSYVDIHTGRPVQRSAVDLGAQSDREFNDAVRRLNAEHKDVQVTFNEVHYTDDEHRLYRELDERYRTREMRPSEVMFVATRHAADDDPKEELRKIWRDGDGARPSRFIERNDYPPLCRFAVYELLEKGNSSYEQDELRFWLSILTLAISQAPPSGFQADRLYRLGVEFSNPELADCLNEHLSILSTGLVIVEAAMDQERPEDDVDVAEVLAPVPIAVDFENVGGHELQVARTGYHLASDRPRDEWGTWALQVAELERKSSRFMGKPRRAVVRAVGNMHQDLEAESPPYGRLKAIAADELDDALAKELQELTSPEMSEVLNRSRLEELIEAMDRKVSRHIGNRLRRRAILGTLALVIGVWFAALLPYLLQAYRRGAAVFGWATGATLGLLGVLALTVLLTLVVMRWQLVRRLDDVNRKLRAYVTGVKVNVESLSMYLGRFVTYRRARERLEQSRILTASDQEARARLGRIRAKIIATMDAEKDIITSLGLPLRVTRRLHEHDDFDPESEPAVKALFRIPKGDGQAEFNHSGDTIAAPYDFVTRLNVEALAVTEPALVSSGSGAGARP